MEKQEGNEVFHGGGGGPGVIEADCVNVKWLQTERVL